jgi:[ribosomal protein S18]-alanine N-acetyltransferase
MRSPAVDAARGGIGIHPLGTPDLAWLEVAHAACFDEAWSRRELAHILALPGAFGLLARLPNGADEDRIGFALCHVAPGECELLSLGVLPAFRRRGAAARLLEAATERAAPAGARAMFLEVAVDNSVAQSLYRRHGFRTVGRREGYYARPDGNRVAAFTMRRELRAAAAAAGPWRPFLRR